MENLTPNCTSQQKELIDSIYKAEFTNMRNFAYSILKDDSLAEVAVQEAFLIAVRAPQKLWESPKPVGWMYEVLKHVLKHMKRDRQKLMLRTVSMAEAPVRELSKEDKYTEISDELAESPDMELLTQFYLEGYSIKEIALEDGRTVGAVKMRLKRARERMRERL